MVVWVRTGMLGAGLWDRMLEPARVVYFVHDVAVNVWSVINARHECWPVGGLYLNHIVGTS
jgi:hypothetical protein